MEFLDLKKNAYIFLVTRVVDRPFGFNKAIQIDPVCFNLSVTIDNAFLPDCRKIDM